MRQGKLQGPDSLQLERIRQYFKKQIWMILGTSGFSTFNKGEMPSTLTKIEILELVII